VNSSIDDLRELADRAIVWETSLVSQAAFSGIFARNAERKYRENKSLMKFSSLFILH